MRFPTPNKLRERLLTRFKESKETYAFDSDFALFQALIHARKKAGLTQRQVALRMGTKTSAVARLESLTRQDKPSPSLATIRRYAEAVHCQLELRLIPKQKNSLPVDGS